MSCYPRTVKDYPDITNNYFVKFTDPSDPKWINPLASYKKDIRPFIPKSALTHVYAGVHCSAEVFGSDCFRGYYVFLDPKDLCAISETSKGGYLALKASSIWRAQLRKILPHVTFLTPQQCRFSQKHQFQIIFKRLQDVKKPFVLQLRHNFVKIKEFEKALVEYVAKLQLLNIPKEHIAYQMAPEHGYLRRLVGSTYNGSVESIDPKSLQGRCLKAFQCIYEDFNDQNTLKEAIFKSEPFCCLF